MFTSIFETLELMSCKTKTCPIISIKHLRTVNFLWQICLRKPRLLTALRRTLPHCPLPPPHSHFKDIVKYSLAISLCFFFNGMECVFSISHQFQMPCKTCTEKDMLLSYFSCKLPYAKILNHTLLSL